MGRGFFVGGKQVGDDRSGVDYYTRRVLSAGVLSAHECVSYSRTHSRADVFRLGLGFGFVFVQVQRLFERAFERLILRQRMEKFTALAVDGAKLLHGCIILNSKFKIMSAIV